MDKKKVLEKIREDIKEFKDLLGDTRSHDTIPEDVLDGEERSFVEGQKKYAETIGDFILREYPANL